MKKAASVLTDAEIEEFVNDAESVSPEELFAHLGELPPEQIINLPRRTDDYEGGSMNLIAFIMLAFILGVALPLVILYSRGMTS